MRGDRSAVGAQSSQCRAHYCDTFAQPRFCATAGRIEDCRNTYDDRAMQVCAADTVRRIEARNFQYDPDVFENTKKKRNPQRKPADNKQE